MYHDYFLILIVDFRHQICHFGKQDVLFNLQSLMQPYKRRIFLSAKFVVMLLVCVSDQNAK